MRDLIERQAAIDMCRKPHMRNADCSDFEMGIMMLPSAKQDQSQMAIDIATILQNIKDMRMMLKTSGRSINPETAHWVLLDECSNSGYYCSKCRKKVVKEGWSGTVKKIKFCPNCGAEMKGQEKTNE